MRNKEYLDIIESDKSQQLDNTQVVLNQQEEEEEAEEEKKKF